MDDLTVVRVDRPEGKVIRVVISIAAYQISFIKRGGKVVKESVTRLDEKRIYDEESLWLPPRYYKDAVERARAIFWSK